VSKFIYEAIALRRKKLVFHKKDVPFPTFKRYIIESQKLQFLQFTNPFAIRSNDVFAVEQMNMIELKILDISALYKLSEKAVIRMIRRSKNIEDLRVNCIMDLSDDFFYCIRNCSQLTTLNMNSIKKLGNTDLMQAQKVLQTFSKHIEHIKIKNLGVYELNDSITTAYSNNEEAADMLTSLSFANVNEKDGFDLLNDLVFFTSLKQLGI